jgi:RNA polymerase sigma-70 factor (ECF subfamily)
MSGRPARRRWRWQEQDSLKTPHGKLKEELPLHIRSLYRYALALTRNDDEAHDLVQDCCTVALDKQDMFKPGTNLRAWLFTIMHNRHVTRLRRRMQGVEHVPVSQAARVSQPSNQLSRLEFRDLVAAMEQLDDEFREVLVLVTVEGLSYKEVAEVLDMPVGTVTSRLSRARAQLRRLMAGSGQKGAGPVAAPLRVVK